MNYRNSYVMYKYLIGKCEKTDEPGESERNAGLADIAEIYGCNEQQIDEIYWFGDNEIEEPVAAPETTRITWEQYNDKMNREYRNHLQQQIEHDQMMRERTRTGYYDNVTESIERCEKCGQTANEGAMFTTMKNSGICDDCL